MEWAEAAGHHPAGEGSGEAAAGDRGDDVRPGPARLVHQDVDAGQRRLRASGGPRAQRARVRCSGPKMERGHPRRIGEWARERICLIARTTPAEWGITAFSTWSLAKLAAHLLDIGLVTSLSPTH